MTGSQWANVLMTALALGIAFVRWRREALALDVRALQARVEQLESSLETSLTERKRLQDENAKLRERCARYLRKIKRMGKAHAKEVAELRRAITDLQSRLSRVPAAAPPPEN